MAPRPTQKKRRSRKKAHQPARARQVLTIDATPKMKRYLEKLVDAEIYGNTPDEVATRLVARGIETAIERGLLERIKT